MLTQEQALDALRTVADARHPLIGRVVTQFDRARAGVSVARDAYARPREDSGDAP